MSAQEAEKELVVRNIEDSVHQHVSISAFVSKHGRLIVGSLREPTPLIKTKSFSPASA